MSRKVLDLLPSDIPRELMVVKNAGHGGKEDPIMIDFENFIDKVSLFLKKNIVDK